METTPFQHLDDDQLIEAANAKCSTEGFIEVDLVKELIVRLTYANESAAMLSEMVENLNCDSSDSNS